MEPVETDPIETTAEPSVPAPPAADAEPTTTEVTVAHRNISEWHGRDLVDRSGERIGRLEDVCYDVETEEPQFGTVKEGLINRHLTFVPLAGVTIGPDNLQVTVTKDQVKKAPNVGLNDLSRIDEPNLYHYYQLNYTPLDTESGRRLARR
jgi:uncharacterized protein YrrD